MEEERRLTEREAHRHFAAEIEGDHVKEAGYTAQAREYAGRIEDREERQTLLADLDTLGG